MQNPALIKKDLDGNKQALWAAWLNNWQQSMSDDVAVAGAEATVVFAAYALRETVKLLPKAKSIAQRKREEAGLKKEGAAAVAEAIADTGRKRKMSEKGKSKDASEGKRQKSNGKRNAKKDPGAGGISPEERKRCDKLLKVVMGKDGADVFKAAGAE
eukprot:SAG22_NODE_1505_length_4274_cov_2.037365_3_plen_157_part_00